jgi:hypothetical protein
MRKKKHIENEIIKLRKMLRLLNISEAQKHSIWCSMLTLQWVKTNKKIPFGPSTICYPQLGKK